MHCRSFFDRCCAHRGCAHFRAFICYGARTSGRRPWAETPRFARHAAAWCISLVMGPLDYAKGRHTSKLFLLGLNLCAVIWGLPTCTPLRWTQITKQDVFKDLLEDLLSVVSTPMATSNYSMNSSWRHLQIPCSSRDLRTRTFRIFP